MDHNQKLAFIASMTDKALKHAASTPNVMAPKGGMSHDKMLSFVQSMTKNGIEYMDQGGIGGAVSNLLGSTNNFQAGQAQINPGTNQGQLNTAYEQSQLGINNQNHAAGTLTPGLQSGASQQSQLANMYLNQAQGNGPSPAQAELAQATGQNVEQQAALMAGQRGAGSNPALAAEMAARQGANTEQQAVGQAATLKAQEQLAAENNLQNLSANQINQGLTSIQGQNNAIQNEQNVLQGANTAANNANVSMQSNLNNVNAGVAGQNAQTSGNIAGNLLGGAASLLSFGLFADGGLVKMDQGGNVLDANARKHIAPANFALPGRRYPIHDISHARNALARVSQYGTPAEKAKVRAAVHKKYPSIAGNKMADGGYVPNFMAQGGMPNVVGQSTSGPQSYAGQWLNSQVNTQGPVVQSGGPLQLQGATPLNGVHVDLKSKKEDAKPDYKVAQGGGSLEEGEVPQGTGPLAADPLSAGGGYQLGSEVDAGSGALAPSAVSAPAFNFGMADGGYMKKGGEVKANSKKEKAEVPGDSLKNDKVPAMLSQGEGVIDRETMADPGPMGHMARAVMAHVEAKKGKKK